MPIILPMFWGVGWLGVECQVKAGFAAADRRLQATYQRAFGDKLSPISGQRTALVPGWPVLVGRGGAGLTGVQGVAGILSLLTQLFLSNLVVTPEIATGNGLVLQLSEIGNT
jgi:hypothetical protein